MRQRILFTISFIFFLAVTSYSQNNSCNLKLSQLKSTAELQGFRLGMTLDEVKAIVPTIPIGKSDDLGIMKTSFSPRFDTKIEKAKFENVRTVSFEFLDNKVMDLWIGYTSEFKWTNLDEFITQMSELLGLPPDIWKTKGIERRLDCEEFQITASMIAAGPTIRFTDKLMKKTWEERRALKAEETDSPYNNQK